MFGQTFRYIDNEKIIHHLQQFSSIKNLCFDEPNFTADKQRAIRLLQEMKDHGIFPKYAWPSVSIDVANNKKLLQLCSDVADFHFLIGLESVNEQVLKGYNKKHTPQQMRKAIDTIHDYGIKIQGSFIFGSDHDDPSVVQQTVDFCHDAEVDFPGFFPLTPYVGTEIRQELEQQQRIFSNNWDVYDGAHVVFHPKHMTAYELQQGVIDAFEGFYSSKKILHHLFDGDVFYSVQTFLFRMLIERVIHTNKDYLAFLEKESRKKSVG